MLWRGRVPAARQLAGRGGVRRPPDVPYNGKEIDQQVHLGFDLAVTSGRPVVAANNGKVVFADYLGIYGNCVIIDHGLGVQSLYAHLSSIDVKDGDTVDKGPADRPQRHDRPGRRRPPALHDAGARQPRQPGGVVDRKWMEDRVLRKMREAAEPRAVASGQGIRAQGLAVEPNQHPRQPGRNPGSRRVRADFVTLTSRA